MSATDNPPPTTEDGGPPKGVRAAAVFRAVLAPRRSRRVPALADRVREIGDEVRDALDPDR